jgi:aryl-alcohol dehydrogenase-like predicted oxidoreductase
MEYRNLGRSGLRVSAFSFGAMTFGGTGRFAEVGHTQAADARRQVDMCLEAGVNLFDTADAYSAGQSEELLAGALGARRQDVLIATKAFAPMGAGPNDAGASRHHIVRACEASLRRLKTDWIDLYQLHNQDLTTPLEETLRALDDLVRAGKVRYVGSSNYTGWMQMKALATSDHRGLERYASQQIQYSLLVRDAEAELLPLGVHEGCGALVWGPLASGYLSGKFRDGPAGDQTRIGARGLLHAMDTPRARQVLAAIDEVCAEHPGASPSQVALNWVARRAGVSSIILGARTSGQLADNLAAANWSLSDAEMAKLDAASAVPPRYPYHMQLQFAATRNPPLQHLPRPAG